MLTANQVITNILKYYHEAVVDINYIELPNKQLWLHVPNTGNVKRAVWRWKQSK